MRARAVVVGRADDAGSLGFARLRREGRGGSANERSREAPGGRGCNEVPPAASRGDDDRAPAGDAPPVGGGGGDSGAWASFDDSRKMGP